MKKVAMITSGVLISGLLLGTAGCKKEKAARAERVTRVTVEQPQKRVLRSQIPVQGIVTPLQYATLSAKISGTLEVMKVSEGDVRKKGDMLFGIDRQILKNQVIVKEDEIRVKKADLHARKLALSTAEIQFKQAQSDYERALRLKQSHAVSLASFETAETEFKTAEKNVQNAKAGILSAEAQLKQSESNLAIARKNLEDSVIKAPFDCVVTETYPEENEYVSVGQKILKLENHTAFEIVCHISAVYYHKITVGKTVVHLLDQQGNIKGKAVVTYKAPGVDPSSRTFELKILVPKETRVISGMLCELNIVLEEKETYALPTDAVLLRANNRRIVFTANDKQRAESVVVKQGIIDGSYCEIENAQELLGKQVIVTGQTYVNNGSKVQIIKK
ncbi:MAG: efflux RND transporter periplasmic adaptor subunit [Lentisphaeria bacterium]|nr:efflux RND transporter periplasmic adaptor subunit [Lentisphaeria bacterium]MBQ8755365.1 efflux RND transporter periplasmic adaptor subunit [Lentisphaeria bacterium]